MCITQIFDEFPINQVVVCSGFWGEGEIDSIYSSVNENYGLQRHDKLGIVVGYAYDTKGMVLIKVKEIVENGKSPYVYTIPTAFLSRV